MKATAFKFKSQREKAFRQQLVLFNQRELRILNQIKPSQKVVDNIKKIKHLFHGELVTTEI